MSQSQQEPFLGTEERTQAYRDALDVEHDGYEEKLASAKLEQNEAAVTLYTRLLKEVDAEKKRSLAEDGVA